MPRKGWVNVSIPEEMAELIDEIVEKRKVYGYRSRQDFVIDAIRRRLRELGYLK